MTGAELRASILQAAVQGKLVPQDPNDEPACVLLERIREERRELVKQKKAKAPRGGESVITRYPDGTVWEQRGKGAAVEITDEVPFDIPDGWEWARLETVTSYIQRGKSPRYSLIAKYPVVAQKCNQWSGFSLEKAKFVDPDTVSSYGEERILRDGDLLWNSTGLGTLGRMAIYDSKVNEYGWAVADSHVTVIRTYPEWLSYRYAFTYFSGPSVQNVIEDKASGSTKQKELNQETVKNYLIPVPPFAEQQRIVAKLDELMPMVERYDKLDRERTELNACIEGALRASILQAAVQGKLVPQDPTDESASQLLERIREERCELVKQKKAKAPKGGESVITRYPDGTVWEQRGKGAPVEITDEVPFDIPDGWEWARLETLTAAVETPFADGPFGSNLKKAHYVNRHEVRIIQLSNIGEDGWRNENEKYTSFEHLKTISRSEVQPGDIVIAKMMPAGRAIEVPDLGTKYVLSSDGVKFVPSPALCKRFLLYAINSRMFREQVSANAQGMTRIRTSVTKLRAYYLPVPPFAEQQRIVAKLDEMLLKVERLGEIAS